VWLPGVADGNFTQNTGLVNGGTQIAIGLKDVDAVANTTNTAKLNGYFEISTIYEWIPSNLAGGVTVAPTCPPPYTVSDCLQIVKNNIPEIITGDIVPFLMNKTATYVVDKGTEWFKREVTGGVQGTSKAPKSNMTSAREVRIEIF